MFVCGCSTAGRLASDKVNIVECILLECIITSTKIMFIQCFMFAKNVLSDSESNKSVVSTLLSSCKRYVNSWHESS